VVYTVSYRQQIARQYLCHKNILIQERGLDDPVKMFILFDRYTTAPTLKTYLPFPGCMITCWICSFWVKQCGHKYLRRSRKQFCEHLGFAPLVWGRGWPLKAFFCPRGLSLPSLIAVDQKVSTYQWCGLRLSVWGQDRPESKRIWS